MSLCISSSRDVVAVSVAIDACDGVAMKRKKEKKKTCDALALNDSYDAFAMKGIRVFQRLRFLALLH